MSEVRKLQVLLADRLVGTIAETPDREIFFEYSLEWLRGGFPISPFNLPLTPGLKHERSGVFGGLFGVFDDSLPDGWGLLLMDRFFRGKGITPEALSPLDRLSYVGKSGIGALGYRPVIKQATGKQEWMDLGTIAAQAERIIAGSPEEALPALRAAGGASSGSRPKVFVAYNPGSGHMSSDTLQPGTGYEHWLIKFRTETDQRDAGCIEEAYAQMARAAGIEMPATRTFDTKAGRFFGVQRFDRKAGGLRIHTHTYGGMVNSNFRHPNRDYREFIGVVFEVTKDFQQVEQAFRRAAFNVLAHNRDDHVKNFSFLCSKSGQWRLSPAYDLTLSGGIGGQHNMTVMGIAKPGRNDLKGLGKDAGIAGGRVEAIINEVSTAVMHWPEFGEKAGVSKASIRAVSEALLVKE